MTAQTLTARPAIARPTIPRSVVAPVVAGVVAAGLTALGVWIPSASGDETATASAVARSLPDLARMATGSVDAVHGLYYAVLHLWVEVFGFSPFAMRAFSAVGVGVGAAGTVLVARRIGGDRLVPIVAALYLSVPMVTWAASEARSYAWIIAVNAWAAVALLRAVRCGGRWWIAYSLVAALTVVVFIYSALVVLAHAVVIATAKGAPLQSRLLGLASTAGAALLASPVLLLAVAQRAQVAWIGPLTPEMLRSAVLQWFGESPLYAVPAWAAIVLGVIVLAAGRGVVHRGDRRLALTLVLPWLLGPTALLLIATGLGEPSYVGRYAAVSVPAVALAMGIGVAALGRRALAGVVLLLVVSLPTFLVQRMPLANGTDWSSTAETVAEWAPRADAFYFAQTGAVTQPRLMLAMYRPEFDGLTDMGVQWSAASLGGLFDSLLPVDEALTQSRLPNSVIVVADNAAPWWNSLEMQAFYKQGYLTVDSRVDAATSVFLVVRQPSPGGTQR